MRNVTLFIVFAVAVACRGDDGPLTESVAAKPPAARLSSPRNQSVIGVEYQTKAVVLRDVGLGRSGPSRIAPVRSPSKSAVIGAGASAPSVQRGISCQPNDIRVSRTSERFKFYVADDFVPGVGGAVSSVVWRGAYADIGRGVDCAQEVLNDSFNIKYTLDGGGVPGTLVALFTQVPIGASPLVVTGRVSTGELIDGVAAEFEYTATHAPIELLAGQCYWIEITNELTLNTPTSNCAWQWEAALGGNDLAVQSPDGVNFHTNDWIPFDFAFCLDVPLGDSAACVPPPPLNDDCGGAQPISGRGTFDFDTTFARTDATAHGLCTASGTADFDADVWFCWTAPCDGVAFASTCGLTSLDTRIAVYNGCGVCPPSENGLVACNDDRCGDELPLQSLAAFTALKGERYTVRVGMFPGALRGAAPLKMECDPPAVPNCPGFGNCRVENGTPGCEDSACCSLVCACDPFCCSTNWDVSCATVGSLGAPGCGAQIMCTPCGSPSAGDCCSATPGMPGCSSAACCLAVCFADSFCCENEWDSNCAADGVNHNGNGAQALCPDLCGIANCPDVAIDWLDHVEGDVDARQPFAPSDPSTAQGVDSVLVGAPAEVAVANCWQVCDPAVGNGVASVTVESIGRIRIGLDHPMTPGEVTTISYRGNASSASFIIHPGNVTGNATTDTLDILALIDELTGPADRFGIQSEDIDRSGALGPGDLLRLIDLVQGGGPYAPGWNGEPRPVVRGPCIR